MAIDSTSPELQTPPEPIDWHDAVEFAGALMPGDVITGFADYYEVDLLAHNLARNLQGNPPDLEPDMDLSAGGRLTFVGWRRDAMLPSVAIARSLSRFTGTYDRDIRVVILPTPAVPDGARALPATSFLISATMDSTGRHDVGALVHQCTVKTYTLGKYETPITTIENRTLSSTLAQVERLRSESAFASYVVKAANVANAFQGGQPGTGVNAR